MNLNELGDRSYKTACKHGWHDEEYSNEHFLMLIVTELSEAVNAERKSKYAMRKMFEDNANIPQPHPEKHWKFCFEQFIKDSVEDELSDVVIRCLDLAGLKEIYLPTLSCINDPAWKKESFNVPFTEFAYCLCRLLLNERSMLYERIYNVIVHIFVYCRFKGIDIEWQIEQKMKYNELRPYKHGNKKY